MQAPSQEKFRNACSEHSMVKETAERDDDHEGGIQDHEPRMPRRGDIVAAQIGEGSSHVAVGKNIIQIGTLSIPRWALFLAIFATGLAGLLIAVNVYVSWITGQSAQQAVTFLHNTATPAPTVTATPTHTPTPMPFAPANVGETLIVIARFHKTATDTEPEVEIYNGIKHELGQAGQDNVRVEVDFASELTADQRTQAEALGNRFNASVVIWGADTGVRVVVNFLNLRQPELPIASVQINETARSLLANPSAYQQFITNNLPRQLAFLSLFAIGQSHYVAARYDRAIEVVESALALEDQPGESILGLRDAHFLLGWLYQQPPPRIEDAIATYDRAVELDPAYADAINNRGTAHYAIGDYDAALADFRQVIVLDPAYADAYNSIGRVLIAVGEITPALASIQQAIDLAPRDPFFRFSLAGTFEEAGNYVAAAQAYRAAIDLDPAFGRAYNGLGFVLLEQLQWREAEAILQRGLAIEPTRASIHKNLGRAYLGLGKLQEAAAELQHALDLLPNRQQPHLLSQSPDLVYYDALYQLALVFQQLGQVGSACQMLGEYSRFAGNDPDKERPSAVRELLRELDCS